MPKEEQVYRELQKHLDKQAVGFPATKSGAELKILKRFFNPEEARLAMHLSYKPRSVEHIYETAKEMGISLLDTEKMLGEMTKNGVIESVEREGARYFYAMGISGQTRHVKDAWIQAANRARADAWCCPNRPTPITPMRSRFTG